MILTAGGTGKGFFMSHDRNESAADAEEARWRLSKPAGREAQPAKRTREEILNLSNPMKDARQSEADAELDRWRKGGPATAPAVSDQTSQDIREMNAYFLKMYGSTPVPPSAVTAAIAKLSEKRINELGGSPDEIAQRVSWRILSMVEAATASGEAAALSDADIEKLAAESLDSMLLERGKTIINKVAQSAGPRVLKSEIVERLAVAEGKTAEQLVDESRREAQKPNSAAQLSSQSDAKFKRDFIAAKQARQVKLSNQKPIVLRLVNYPFS